MAQKVLILGDSGTGKSASLRNFDPSEVLVINCAGKPLPFRNNFEQVTPSYEHMTEDVRQAMAKASMDGKKVVIIDDAQYIMSFQYMRRIKENGWDKWNDIQGEFFNIINDCNFYPPEMVFYFLAHIQRDDQGREKIKTMGKMLDEKITIEGLFTIVLKTIVSDGHYYFATQNNGMDTVKSPMKMFGTYAIANDLKFVDECIRAYWGIGKDAPSDAQVAEMAKAVEAPEIAKPDSDGRKRRTKRSQPADKVEAESTEEKPKRRTRKKRDEQDQKEEPQEAPVEEEAQEAAGDESAAAERPRRRRRRRSVSAEVQAAVDAVEKHPVSDDEIPFDVNDED